MFGTPMATVTLDFTAAFAVAGLGHNAPPLREAMIEQAGRLIHGMGDVHPTELKVRLCEELGAVTFGRWLGQPGKTILTNAGFEAVEAALKTSLLHSGKAGVIAFAGAYHGLGYGALGVSGLPMFRDPFRSQLREFATILPYPSCYRCPFGERAGYRLEGGSFPNCSSTCLEKLDGQIRQAIEKRPTAAAFWSSLPRDAAATCFHRWISCACCVRSATNTKSCSSQTRFTPASTARVRFLPAITRASYRT